MLNTGDTVKVHYTGKYEDGDVFDSTATTEPIMFTIGDEMMLEGFEKAVLSMEVGEKKTIRLKPKDAYGEYDPNLIFTLKKDEAFKDKEVKIGDEVQIPTEDSVFSLTVISIVGNEVRLDGNSPMAGREVIFDIELLDVVSAGSDSIDEYGDFEDFESIDDIMDEY